MAVRQLESVAPLKEALRASLLGRAGESEQSASDSPEGIRNVVTGEVASMRAAVKNLDAVTFAMDEDDYNPSNGLVEVWYTFPDGRQGGFAFRYHDLLPFLK